MYGLDTPINTAVFLRKWNIKLLHTLYKGYINFKYFLLATDWQALPSFVESVQRFIEIMSKLNNEKHAKLFQKRGKMAKILKQKCKPVRRVKHAARDVVFCCSHRLLNWEISFNPLPGTVKIEGPKQFFKAYDVFIYLWKYKIHYYFLF